MKKKIKLEGRYTKAWAIIKENAFKEGRYEALYPLYETKKEAETVNKKEKGIVKRIKVQII